MTTSAGNFVTMHTLEIKLKRIMYILKAEKDDDLLWLVAEPCCAANIKNEKALCRYHTFIGKLEKVLK